MNRINILRNKYLKKIILQSVRKSLFCFVERWRGSSWYSIVMKINQEMIHRRQVHQFRQDLVVPIVFLSSVRYRKGFRWDPLIVPCIYRSICLTLPFSLAFFTRPSIESYHASPFVTITQHVPWRMARWCSRKGCKNLKSLLLPPGPFNPYFSFLISSQDIPFSEISI